MLIVSCTDKIIPRCSFFAGVDGNFKGPSMNTSVPGPKTKVVKLWRYAALNLRLVSFLQELIAEMNTITVGVIIGASIIYGVILLFSKLTISIIYWNIGLEWITYLSH